MKLVLLLLGLAAYVAAQVPVPCESPKQWSSRVYRSDESKGFVENGKLTYDETNTRFRIIEEVELGETRDYYDTLYLHNVQKEYKLNLKTKQCNVTALTRPFRPYGVPPFAHYVFGAEVGAASVPGEHMPIQSWDGEYEDKSYFFTMVTMPDCVPLRHGFFSNETGFVSSHFYDTALGITDPTVFNPPAECLK